mmetsp:Transcript_30723/g.30251  ORF Transcript_30723/g.30251 Transcript_30723/m.30251 type:complete len:168 (+) Transcript_30723:1414-1917(+)
MRNFIDRNSEQLEVIRVEDVHINKRAISANNLPLMNEISDVKPVLSKASTSLAKFENLSALPENRNDDSIMRRRHNQIDVGPEPSVSPDISRVRESHGSNLSNNHQSVITPQRVSQSREEIKEDEQDYESIESEEEEELVASRGLEAEWRIVSSPREKHSQPPEVAS